MPLEIHQNLDHRILREIFDILRVKFEQRKVISWRKCQMQPRHQKHEKRAKDELNVVDANSVLVDRYDRQKD